MNSFNELVEDIEKELIKLFRDIGVASINTGDIYKIAPRYPAVDIMLVSREQNGIQVLQKNKIGWDLNYDITCMFSGSEAGQTFKNARKFVDKIYDLLQEQKTSHLNNTAFDLECIRVEYGRAKIKTDVLADGGLIKLVIQIIELR